MNNKNFIVYIMLTMLAVSMYIYQDYLYIMLVSMILVLSTNSIFMLLNERLKKVKYDYVKKNYRIITSLILTLSFALIIFLPFIYFISYSYINFMPTINVNELKNKMDFILINLKSLPPYLSIFQDNVNLFLKEFSITEIDTKIVKDVITKIFGIIKNVNSIIMNLLLVLFFYFMINLYGRKIQTLIVSMLPLEHNNKVMLLNEFTNTSAIVLYGSLFSMIAQGFAFFILMLFFDYNAIYLGVMAGFLSIIPIVGAALVFIPIVILEIINQNIFGAVFILMYSIIFMGFIIDNIFKIKFISFINKKIKFNYSLNELMILFAMIAGVSTFGFWGLIIAPALTALTFASINLHRKILKQEKKKKNNEIKIKTQSNN